ncbi:MAG: hypothetical protein ACR2HM_11110 [Acidimicrobiales bacterium]
MNKTVAVAVGFVALVLGGASLAWACTPQASLGAFTPFQSPPGTVVTVTGSTFEDGPVEIRWGGRNGPVIGVAQGPDFSTSVTIPPAAPGVYFVAAVSYDDAGQYTSRAKPFEVTAPPAESRPDKPPPVQPPVDQPPVDQPPVDQAPVDQAPVGGVPADQVEAEQPAATDAAAPTAAPAAGPAAPVVRPAGPNASAEPEARRAPAVADRVPAAAAPPESPLAAPEATPARPLAEIISGDLWSGFAAGPDVAAPSLTDSPSTSSRTATLTMGMALLAAGLVALFGGAVATVTARRRSHADAGPATR